LEALRHNKVQGVRYYRLAAKEGHADAQSNLGYGYSKGKGVAQYLVKGIRYYRLAAEQCGHAVAQINLGYCYANGRGVAQDLVEGVRCYRLPADRMLARCGCCVLLGLWRAAQAQQDLRQMPCGQVLRQRVCRARLAGAQAELQALAV
jgi:TPR repeat protein